MVFVEKHNKISYACEKKKTIWKALSSFKCQIIIFNFIFMWHQITDKSSQKENKAFFNLYLFVVQWN